MIRELIIQWLARKHRPQEFAFSNTLRNAKRILVLMPEELDAFRQSEYFLSRLPQAFEKARVTLLYPPKSLAPRFYTPRGYRVIVPENKQVWWWNLPRQTFMDSVFESKYDLVIILNKTPSVFYSAVAMHAKTPVRIGLPGGMGHPFVTVELRHGREAADTKTEFILFVEMLRKMTRNQMTAPTDDNPRSQSTHPGTQQALSLTTTAGGKRVSQTH